MLRTVNSLTLLAALFGAVSCGVDVKRFLGVKSGPDEVASRPQERNEDHALSADSTGEHFLQLMSDDQLRKAMLRALQDIGADSISDDVLWALAHCRCATNFSRSLIRNWTRERGALPQILAPQIREEVKNDENLKLLASLPDFLKSFITKKFADDETISAKIREGLLGKIKKVIQKVLQLEELPGWRFDHFIQVAAKDSQKAEFSVLDQVHQWAVIFSKNSMWAGKPSEDDDHSIQLFATMRALSELQYLFGLKRSAEGKPYGGLTYSVEYGPAGGIGAFDPRGNSESKRYLSGRFAVEYKNAELVKMATEVEETWHPLSSDISLDEQAKLWFSAALMLQRLRPNARNAVAKIFGGNGILPEDAHGIALILLGSMEGLLSGPFVNEKGRFIRSKANLSLEGDEEGERELASLMELVHLAEALSLWIKQLSSTADLKIPGVDLDKLNSAPAKLTRALQLVVQIILRDFIKSEAPEGLAGSTEVLVALLSIEHDILNSPVLRSIMSDFLVRQVVQPIRSRLLAAEPFSVGEILWIYSVAKLLVARMPVTGTLNKVQEFLIELDKALEGLTL